MTSDVFKQLKVLVLVPLDLSVKHSSDFYSFILQWARGNSKSPPCLPLIGFGNLYIVIATISIM